MHINHFTYLLKLAYRNITRNKLRSFFISFSVAISVTLAVWVMSLFDGMNSQIVDAIINCNVGHFQIQEDHYGKNNDPNNPGLKNNQLLDQLKRNKQISGISSEMVLEGFINDPEGSEAVDLIGIYSQEHKTIMPIYKSIIQGSYIQEADQGVLIGEMLQKKFKLKINDNLVINYQDTVGNLRSEVLKIQGVYRLNGASFERKTVYLPINKLQELFGKQGIHRYVIFAPKISSKDSLQPFVPGGHSLKSWHDINPELSVVLEFHHGTVRFFLLIVGICISVTILTPISMLWQERIKEFETLHIIGIKRSVLWKIGISEAVLLSNIALILACFLVILGIGPFLKTGLDLSSLRNGGITVERAGILLPHVVFPLLNFSQFFISCIFVIFTVFISYFFAIRKTVRQIRYQ